MSANDQTLPDVTDESPLSEDSLAEHRELKRAKLADARARADKIISEMRQRRRAQLDAWCRIGDVAAEVLLDLARKRAGPELTVEEAFCLLQGETQTKH